MVLSITSVAEVPRSVARIPGKVYKGLVKKGEKASGRLDLPGTQQDAERADRGYTHLEKMGLATRGSVQIVRENPAKTVLITLTLLGLGYVAVRYMLSEAVIEGAAGGRQLMSAPGQGGQEVTFSKVGSTQGPGEQAAGALATANEGTVAAAASSSEEYVCGGVTYGRDTICSTSPETTVDPTCMNRQCAGVMREDTVAATEQAIAAQGTAEQAKADAVEAKDTAVGARNTTLGIGIPSTILTLTALGLTTLVFCCGAICGCQIGGALSFLTAFQIVLGGLNTALSKHFAKKAECTAQKKVHENDL
ncbi:hypothetical protein ACFL96_01465 [Thermoproteota archaeon]